MNKEEWLLENSDSESDCIYKDDQNYQINWFEKIAENYKLEIDYVGFHYSKSVRFPVVIYTLKNGALIYVRNNLYNIECIYKGSPIKLNPCDFYHHESFEWYYEQLNRAKQYHTLGKESDTTDYSNLDWYITWSGNKLIKDKNGYLIVPRLYLEGISRVISTKSIIPYSENSELFGWSVSNFNDLKDQIQFIITSLSNINFNKTNKPKEIFNNANSQSRNSKTI